MRRRGVWSLLLLFVLGFVLLAFAISLAVSIGEISIPLSTTAEAVANRLFGAGFEISLPIPMKPPLCSEMMSPLDSGMISPPV
jgi:hypothetical protein